MSEASPLSDPSIVPNPYPVYSELAEKEPVHWCDSLNAWAVMRYADCASALKDSRFKAERMEEVLGVKFPGRSLPPNNIYHRFTKNVMMWNDAPFHTALRRSTRPGFTPAAHEHYSQVIKRVAVELVATVPDTTKEVDAVSEFAAKLPVKAAVHAFGVPEDDLDFIIPRVNTVLTYWSGPQAQPVSLDHLLDRLTELHTYAVELLGGRRGRVLPDTVIYRLAANQRDNRYCTIEQTVHQLVLLLIALFTPTTPGSLSSGILSFAMNPKEVERFLADPGHADNAADEVFRYNASNQFTWRVAAATFGLNGQSIEEGQNVALFLGAANRDSRVFERPDEFDISRHNSGKHLSFGTGPHVCLGRQIARLEIKWFFVALFARFRKIGLAGEPIWNQNLEFRSLKHLPLALN